MTTGSIELRGDGSKSSRPQPWCNAARPGDGRPALLRHDDRENLPPAPTRAAREGGDAATLEKVYRYFPAQGAPHSSGVHAGGEQQMCATGERSWPARAWCSTSLDGAGAADRREVFEIVRDLNQKEGVTSSAEQNTNMALRYADYGYILESGHRHGRPGDMLRENEDVREFYLGTGSAGGGASARVPRREELQAPQARLA